MNDAPQQKSAAKPADRTPIPIRRLMFASANPHGIPLPSGPDGRSEKISPNLHAGIHGDVKTEIEHRPWMRVFRVTRSKRVSRSGTGKDAKEIVTWEPMGDPFHISDTLAVSVPADE